MSKIDNTVAEGEPFLVLRARDVLAPGLIRSWAAKMRVVDPEKADEADHIAASMGEWKRRNPGVR